MRYLLDTCVISEVVKKAPSSKVTQWLERQDELSLFLSVITFGELHKGIGQLQAGRKQRELYEWVEGQLNRRFTGRILGIDKDVAVRWGEISAVAGRVGRTVPVLDGLLAATALTFGLTFVTRNTDHVLETGVRLLDPWETGFPQ
ncbi:MAG: type II toxin-antitoxin system VapC family toxin [Gemmatimonadetes bacterium]|nr:type II toxin-antitoxin system VapC family toxin [Gemmatimonadota bacterium]